ncbi:MAG TPA: hypothetical protein VFI68_02445 [Anaerolineales bacterium]|nr:hypothetical protein [Anaerolineales bacterium]
MKNIIPLLICSFLFTSCSVFNTGATATPAPTLTITPTTIPSATATVPTPTFTGTPTLIVIPRTNTPTSAALFTQIIQTPLVLVTSDTLTPIPKIKGFVSILVSEKEFHKGKKCLPASVKFTAQVSEPARSAYVVLFVRFKSKNSGVTSEWTSLQMENKGAGTFIYDLTATDMIGDTSFFNAWVEYQLVTTQSNTRVIGRTDIFSERLTLLECNPTPVP